MPLLGCVREGRGPISVDRVRGCASFQQQPDDLGVAVAGGEHESRHQAIEVGGVLARACGEQQVHDLDVVVDRRTGQAREAVVIRHIQLRTSCQQHAQDLNLAGTRRMPEGRSALPVYRLLVESSLKHPPNRLSCTVEDGIEPLVLRFPPEGQG